MGVDHVFETIGGENLNVSLATLRIGGTISFIGLLAGLATRINTYELVTKNVTLQGIESGSQEMYAEMAAFVDDHAVTPVVDSVYPVTQVGEALHHLEQGRHFGKVAITLGR
jgi:NADPH:quinone reductase-like Zn-dependent oxidoreductase